MQIKKFGEILTELRERKFKTKTDLSKEVGITRQQIIKFESGASVPNAADLLALADYFSVSADYLLGRADYITIPSNGENTYLQLPGKLLDRDFKLLEEFADLLLKHNDNV